MSQAADNNAGERRPVKIGVLNDLSGVYSDFQGRGSILAAQMAVEDFGGKVGGHPVEVVFADHQNKADVGLGIARKWFDSEGVDMIIDVPNSAIALGVADLTREKNKVFIGSGAGTAALTGDKCSPNTVHWTYDTWALAHGVSKAVVAAGGKSWYFITVDYAFGHDLEKSATEAVLAAGGSVLGAGHHPLGTSDFASFLFQAQGSGANVVAFANVGGDLTTSLKQAAEFGLGDKQKLVGLMVGINNINALGLKDAQGLIATSSFYWDRTDETRAFTKRFVARHPLHNYPNDMQAGVYAAVLHYLKAIDKLGDATDGKAVVAAMKALPTKDPLFGEGYIREDGRKIHPFYVLQAKTPAESKGEWDYFKIIGTIPAEETFRPLKDGGCPLVATK